MAKARKVKAKGKLRAKLTALERLAQERVASSTIAWARRHPERAKDERRLRVERAQLLDSFSHKRNGTPETHYHHSKPREGSIARLHKSGAIDDDQLAWAAEIAANYAHIGRDVTVRTASLGTRIDSNRHGDAFWEALGSVRMEVAYSRWRTALGPDAAVVLDIVVQDAGISAAARAHRMHVRRARALLLQALDLWGTMKAAARKDIDAATLAAAQAGIL